MGEAGDVMRRKIAAFNRRSHDLGPLRGRRGRHRLVEASRRPPRPPRTQLGVAPAQLQRSAELPHGAGPAGAVPGLGAVVCATGH